MCFSLPWGSRQPSSMGIHFKLIDEDEKMQVDKLHLPRLRWRRWKKRYIQRNKQINKRNHQSYPDWEKSKASSNMRPILWQFRWLKLHDEQQRKGKGMDKYLWNFKSLANRSFRISSEHSCQFKNRRNPPWKALLDSQ